MEVKATLNIDRRPHVAEGPTPVKIWFNQFQVVNKATRYTNGNGSIFDGFDEKKKTNLQKENENNCMHLS